MGQCSIFCSVFFDDKMIVNKKYNMEHSICLKTRSNGKWMCCATTDVEPAEDDNIQLIIQISKSFMYILFMGNGGSNKQFKFPMMSFELISACH